MAKIKDFLIKHISWVVIAIVIFILIYTMCTSNMYAQDEYNYSNITWTSQRLTSLGDLLTSMKLIYKNWSGRLIALGLSQYFLFIGIEYYDILNSIVFVIFIFMLGKVKGNKNTTLGIVTSLLLVGTFVSQFWQKFIWETASFNYLWPVTFMLITMYYFYNAIVNDKKITKLEMAIFYFFSFCAGLSHENTAFVTGSFIIVIGLVNIKKIWKFSIKEKIKIIAPVILFGIGAMILIFAPGNFVRLDQTETGLSADAIFYDFYNIKELIIICIVTTIVLWFLHKESRLEIKRNILYFIIPMLIGLTPMLIIHDFPERAILAYEACIIICTIYNVIELEKLLKKDEIRKALIVVIAIIAIIPLAYKAWFAKKYIATYKEQMEYELQYCEMQGMDEAIIEQFDKLEEAQKLELYMDVFPKVSDISIINVYVARYYGFNRVIAIPKDCVMIEIDITDEEEIAVYNLVKRDTGEIYSARITATELQMPNLSYQNRICFIIPESELENLRVDLPDDIIGKVQTVELKTVRKY